MTALALLGGLAVAGCTESVTEKPDPLAGDVIDEAQISQLLLQAGDPSSAINYFENALAREPERADFRRNLAKSYAKGKRFPESARLFQELVALDQDRPEDLLDYAYVAVRLDDWETARSLSTQLPPSLDEPRRYMLDAMIADHDEAWDSADRAYAQAEKLSPNPSDILNNWGVSLMSRGELEQAEGVLTRAVSYDSTVFSAKNNLAISRGLRGDYRLPIVPMTTEERAKIMYNLGVIALRKGDERTARGLFAAAVDTHPRHYQQAVDQLAQLDRAIIR